MDLRKKDNGFVCKFQGAPIRIEPDGKLIIDFKETYQAVEFCRYLMMKHGIVSLPEIKKESNFNEK